MSAIFVYAENATDYFIRGLKSTSIRTKIKYFSKALELPFCCFLDLNSSLLKKTNKKKDSRIQGFVLFKATQRNTKFAFSLCLLPDFQIFVIL